MQKYRRGLLLRLLTHIEPEVVEEVHIALQLFFALVLRRGPADETAWNTLPMRLQDALQALALFVGGNLAGDADMFDSRHVYHETPWQGDVRGDAGAFLA